MKYMQFENFLDKKNLNYNFSNYIWKIELYNWILFKKKKNYLNYNFSSFYGENVVL